MLFFFSWPLSFDCGSCSAEPGEQQPQQDFFSGEEQQQEFFSSMGVLEQVEAAGRGGPNTAKRYPTSASHTGMRLLNGPAEFSQVGASWFTQQNG